MEDRREVLAERHNAAPAVFRGCSSGRLGFIVGAGSLVWLPAGLAIAWLAGVFTMGFGIAGLGIVATVVAMASVFQRLKRNRPDGYYQQRIVLWLHERGLKRSPFVCRSGAWDIGRTSDASLPSRNR